MCSPAVRAPVALGVQVTVNVVLAPAATVVLVLLASTTKSPAFAPSMANGMLSIRSALPVFWMVKVRVALWAGRIGPNPTVLTPSDSAVPASVPSKTAMTGASVVNVTSVPLDAPNVLVALTMKW